MYFVISGPSASGKSTVVKHLKQSDLALHVPISATTRTLRPGEDINGVTYWFFTEQEFNQKIRKGAFLEFVKLEHSYGTLWDKVKKCRETMCFWNSM